MVSDVEFHVLLIDGVGEEGTEIIYYGLDCLSSDLAQSIKSKYKGDALRWACKPLFLLHLLETKDSVIYVDNDICFFGSPSFLFDELTKSAILLTPHYYEANPRENQNWLEANFRVGLFNAGFVGASREGKNALLWWAECCLYNIKQSPCRGLFDDQKYLDLMPVLFHHIYIVKHKGCNVAGWNVVQCPRTANENGELVLAKEFPLVFIHFANLTFKMIEQGVDPLLAQYSERYLQLLKNEKPSHTLTDELKPRWFELTSMIRLSLWKLYRIFE